MDLGLGNTLLAGDPRLVDHIVGEVKSQGIFDQFRKECIADVDTKVISFSFILLLNRLISLTKMKFRTKLFPTFFFISIFAVCICTIL